MIHENSLEAYRQIDTAEARQKVFAAILKNTNKGGLTRQNLAQQLGWEINRVTGRVRELLDTGRIKETGRIYVDSKPRSLLEVDESFLQKLAG